MHRCSTVPPPSDVSSSILLDATHRARSSEALGSSAIDGIQCFGRLDKPPFHPLPRVRPQLPRFVADVLLIPAILPLLPVPLHRAVPVLRKRLAVDPHGSRPLSCSWGDGLIPERDLPCECWSWSGHTVPGGCRSINRRGAGAHLPFVAPSANLRTGKFRYISAAWQC